MLRSFCAVAAIGNVTRAAEGLARAQSTVSTHIRRIEDVYGGALFDRTAQGMQLTRRGAVVLTAAESILQAHSRALATLEGTELSGLLRVGLMDDYAIDRFPMILKRFCARYPRLELKIEVALSAALHEAVAEGRLDLCVVRRHLGSATGRLLSRERLVWAGSPADLDLDEGRPIPLVMFDEDCLYRAAVIEALRGCGRDYRIVASASSLAGVIASSFAGFGVTVLSERSVPSCLRILDSPGLPALPATEVALVMGDPPTPAGIALQREILRETDRDIATLGLDGMA